MTATGNPPKPRPVWSFARRLGVQAIMSVTVMAGLQLAALSGYGVNDLLPGLASPSPPASDPVRITGVPARFDIPVEVRSAPASVTPAVSAESAARETFGPAMPNPAAKTPAPAPVVAALPNIERVAVPSPRPHLAAAARPVAVPPPPSEAAFDLSPRGVEVYQVTELVREEAPPMPGETDDGFRVGDLVPSGAAILTRTAALTGSAAQAVTGTAARLLDLTR